MALYRDQAVVLRTHKLGEADCIITLNTREHGQIKAIAKEVRRANLDLVPVLNLLVMSIYNFIPAEPLTRLHR